MVSSQLYRFYHNLTNAYLCWLLPTLVLLSSPCNLSTTLPQALCCSHNQFLGKTDLSGKLPFTFQDLADLPLLCEP